ncbi:MAG: hypothetical protein HW403_1176, partial [Dehalococcoidia bacterium]|nr:hypothetical protein [Dehalococcoidia bacterium]
MEVKVRIPTPLRPLAQGQDSVDIAGDTIQACINTLEATYPG